MTCSGFQRSHLRDELPHNRPGLVLSTFLLYQTRSSAISNQFQSSVNTLRPPTHQRSLNLIIRHILQLLRSRLPLNPQSLGRRPREPRRHVPQERQEVNHERPGDKALDRALKGIVQRGDVPPIRPDRVCIVDVIDYLEDSACDRAVSAGRSVSAQYHKMNERSK